MVEKRIQYGLDGLTGDQLFELCEAMCEELAHRDPYLQRMAQATITEASDRLDARRQAARQAVQQALQDYLGAILAEERRAVIDAVRTGELRLVAPEQESAAVADANLRARIAVIDKLVEEIHRGVTLGEDLASLSFRLGQAHPHWFDATQATIEPRPRLHARRPPRWDPPW